MKLTTKELCLDIIIILVSVFAIGWTTIFLTLNPIQCLKGDFHIYYEAGHQHFIYGWYYKNFVAIIFTPLILFNETTALLIYSGVNVICMLLLTHKLCEVKYGWLFVFASLPVYKVILQNSNITIILSVLCCYSIPALLTILVKPHYIIFSFFHFLFLKGRKKIIYLGIAIVFILCAIPSRQVLDNALPDALIRWQNSFLVLPLYYITKKKTIKIKAIIRSVLNFIIKKKDRFVRLMLYENGEINPDKEDIG